MSRGLTLLVLLLAILASAYTAAQLAREVARAKRCAWQASGIWLAISCASIALGLVVALVFALFSYDGQCGFMLKDRDCTFGDHLISETSIAGMFAAIFAIYSAPVSIAFLIGGAIVAYRRKPK